ncbi:MAG: BamA/TamA family outer membrane protein [Proteobacteria bacterium]|nr:BamA/TamA family outer membrane protein [Pseudomonadota bacterium]
MYTFAVSVWFVAETSSLAQATDEVQGDQEESQEEAQENKKNAGDDGSIVPWRSEGVDISTSVLDMLYGDYPNLDNEEDLAQLLEELSQMFPGYDVTPSFDGGMWLIRFQKQPYVDKLVLTTISEERLPSNLAAQLDFYIGTLYSAVVEDRFRKNVIDLLKKEGYYNSQISLKQVRNEARITIEVAVQLGPICYIESIEAEFSLPEDISSIRGSICSQKVMKGYFDDIVDRYEQNNYIEHTLSLGGISYNSKTSYGVFKILGSPGPVIEYVYSINEDLAIGIDNEEITDILAELSNKITPSEFSPYLAINEINKIFFDHDYHLAQTEDPIIERKGSIKRYEFDIQPSIKITEVEIELEFDKEDVQVLSYEEIVEELTTQSFFPFFDKIEVSQIPRRIISLARRYRNLGYWDIAIGNPEYQSMAEEKVKVKLSIQEGRRYDLSSIEFEGNTALSSDNLRKYFDLQSKDPLDQSKVLALRNAVTNAYIQAGYLNVEVKLSVKKSSIDDGFLVDIICEIKEGRKFLFGDVFIFGLTKTSRDVVKREIDFRSLEDYSPKKIQKTYRNIVNLGLFGSVKIIPQGESFSAQGEKIRDIFIILKESDNGRVSFGPGYDLFDGYNYLFDASYNNLWGEGRQISTRIRVNEAKRQVVFRDEVLLNMLLSVGYKHPYIFDYPMDFSTLFTYKTQAENFWQITSRVQEELKYAFFSDERYKFALFMRQSLSSEIGSREQLAYYLSQDEISIFSSGARFRVDLRDHPPWPKEGIDIALEYEKAFYVFNFDTQFDRADIQTSYYQPLSDHIIYLVSARWTTYWNTARKSSTGDAVFPISQLLQAGGTDLVRGFPKDLGPYVAYPVVQSDGNVEYKKDVIGGTSRLVFKQKLRYLFSDNIAINLFYDMGNSYLSQSMVDSLYGRFSLVSDSKPLADIYDNYPLFDSTGGNSSGGDSWQIWRQLYASAGLAFDYFTPIGSLRLSAAHPTYQPSFSDCDSSKLDCLDRRNVFDPYLARFKFDLTIAARF